MDWNRVLDIERAVKNVAIDQAGDWYRDPWGWPENTFIAKGNHTFVVDRANASGARRVGNMDVPKENFSYRPAVIMDPIDRILYQALVDSVSKSLIGNLPPWVFGWRLMRKEPQAGQYARNDREWERQNSSLKKLVSLSDYGLKTDLVSCFASMPVERVCEEVERRAGRGNISSRINSMLQSWDMMPGRHGIPQRSMASAAIANMFIGPLDQRISEFNKKHASGQTLGLLEHLSTRWMDDIWVFSDNDASLRRLQVELLQVAREYELELNANKTNVYEGDVLTAEALRINHSAVESALAGKRPDTGPLEELLDEIIENPEVVDRTSVHFAMVRMRRNSIKSRLPKLRDVAPRIPHGADHLARAFRDLGSWEHLQEWYIEYLKSDWACFEWSSAQLGTMFPVNKTKISDDLIGQFIDVTAGRPSLPVLALTIQRLCKWRPSAVKELIRTLREHADHPLERRLLALAAVAVRDERRIVRELLSGYEESSVTLKMIESNNFKPFEVAKDFEGTVAASNGA